MDAVADTSEAAEGRCVIDISAIRCKCGSADIVLVRPGSEPEIAPGSIVVSQGEPVTGVCMACWPLAPRYQQTLFGEIIR
jgi:hypothetical protein